MANGNSLRGTPTLYADNCHGITQVSLIFKKQEYENSYTTSKTTCRFAAWLHYDHKLRDNAYHNKPGLRECRQHCIRYYGLPLYVGIGEGKRHQSEMRSAVQLPEQGLRGIKAVEYAADNHNIGDSCPANPFLVLCPAARKSRTFGRSAKLKLQENGFTKRNRAARDHGVDKQT